MAEQIKSRIDLEARLYSILSENPGVKQQLQNNPKKYLKEQLGFDVPENITIKIVEYGKNELVLTIPKEINTSSELSEEELDNVAGGTDVPTMVTCEGQRGCTVPG